MTQIHCWNEYDSLKTVILGSVFDNDKVPKMFDDENQEHYIKIVEETNIELKNIEKILTEFGVKVLRPSQPKNYNGDNSIIQDPLINLRDFHLAYGNLFFLFYSPYPERRFHNLWIEDIVNELINDGNLVLSANEINLTEKEEVLLTEHFSEIEEFYKILLLDFLIKPKKLQILKNNQMEDFSNKMFKMLLKKKQFKFLKNFKEHYFDWYIDHNTYYKNKNIFHAASLLKYNDRCFISKYSGSSLGNKWIESWLNQLGVKITHVPYIGHIDGKCSILNKNSLLITSKPKTEITDFFKNVIVVNYDFNHLSNEIFYDKPKLWQTEYKQKFKNAKNVNALILNPENILLNYYDKEIYNNLQNIGIKAEYVEWTHDKFWEGGLHCITCDIERRPE